MNHHKFSNLIQLNAESIGIRTLDNEITEFLNVEIEEKIKAILTQAKKFMRVSKRKTLKVDDLNHSLPYFNFKKLYGYDSYANVEYEKIESVNGLWRPKQNIIDLEEFLSKPIANCPMQPFPHFHWFVIDGKRPNIPENFIREEHKSVQVEYQPTKELLGPDLTAQSVEKQVTSNGNVKQQGNKIIAPVIHNISKELQIFLENFEQRFRKEIKFIHLNPSSNLMLSNEILISLNVIETEPGVVELLPYIIEFLMSNLANQQYIKEPKVHMIILHYIDAILKNPYFYLEPYLHQLVTLILSLILMENSNQFLDQIIRVKDFAIETLSRIHRKYETKYPNFSQQIIRICKDNIVPNINNPCYLTTYGAIKSINAFGPLSIIDHIIPKLDQIIQRFNTIYVLSKHKETYNEDKSQLNLPLTQSQPESFPKISFSMPVGYTINPPITSSILLDASSFDANKKETSQNKVDVKLSDFKNIVTNINEKACYVYNALKESSRIVVYYMTNSEVKNSQLIISKLAEIFGDDIMPANLINSSLNNEGFDLFI